MPIRPWRTRSSRTVFDAAPWFRVVEDTVTLPSGRTVSDFYRIEAPDYALVCARREDGSILMERQFRQCLKRAILTSPGGGVDPGEHPLEAAKRELLEETGYRAQTWSPLGSFVVDGTRGICTAHLFLATGLELSCAPVVDDMEEFELSFLTPEEVKAAMAGGEIPLLPDLAILCAALCGIPAGFFP